MDRFFSYRKLFFALSLCALLGAAAGAFIRPEAEAQPVFFSLLFPQLTPEFDFAATAGEAIEGEAVFL